jgi:glycosyltransferase involved in cell wall biosynthesis
MYPSLPDWAQAALDFSRWRTEEELADKCALVRKKIEAEPTRDRPDVSYVLPVYNEEKLLLGALITIAAQTLQGVERLVVDNNSTDRTRAVAAACGFTVVEESRRGIARARQTGLEAARGAIYASVDADTLYPPTHAGAIRNAYAKNPHLVATGGEYVFIFIQPHIIRYRRMLDRLKGRTRSHHVLCTAAGFNSTYQRRFVQEAGGYRTDLVRFSDIELFARMQKYGETSSTGREARVYTSARREEHRGIVRLIAGSIRHKIRTRMQTLGILNDPLKALVAKEQSFQEGIYPPIR